MDNKKTYYSLLGNELIRFTPKKLIQLTTEEMILEIKREING